MVLLQMPTKVYSTKQAADYLGLSVAAIKKHVHVTKDLVPDQMVGKTLVFSQETLDEFNARRRKAGRPKGTKNPQ